MCVRAGTFSSPSYQMASAAASQILVLLLLLALVADLGSSFGGGGIIQQHVPGSCLCYDSCAHKGEGLKDAASQTCFVDCVLGGKGWMSYCPCDHAKPGQDPADQHQLPAILDKLITVTVARPKVGEKHERIELLRVELASDPFEDYVHRGHKFRMLFAGAVYSHENRRANLMASLVYHTDLEFQTGSAARYFYLHEKLQLIGAGGEKTVTVKFWPTIEYQQTSYQSGLWWDHYKVTVRNVSVVYLAENVAAQQVPMGVTSWF